MEVDEALDEVMVELLELEDVEDPKMSGIETVMDGRRESSGLSLLSSSVVSPLLPNNPLSSLWDVQTRRA